MKKPLEVAEKCYVDVNIHEKKNEKQLNALDQLPSSCYESAVELEAKRAIYEKDGVFDKHLIDGIISKLKSYDDKNIREEVRKNPEKMAELVERYYHCG